MPLKKFAKLVAILGPGLGPSFGTSFGPRFGPYKYDLKERAPKLEPKPGPKPGPKIATNFVNFFRHFSGMQQIFARYGVARVLQLSHFFARVPACVLRRLTTSSYLGGSLNGRQACVGFEVPRTGPFAAQRCVPIAA